MDVEVGPREDDHDDGDDDDDDADDGDDDDDDDDLDIEGIDGEVRLAKRCTLKHEAKTPQHFSD